MNLHRFDQQYERALTIISPLAEKYPSNPLFQLARGDLLAKLGRKPQASECYRAAAVLPVHEPECQARIQQLARAAINRKSTRLNSSHGYISYAVFCLKKKNVTTD